MSASQSDPTIWATISAWGYFFITSLGVLACYFANGGTKGNGFFLKYFSYSFTVGIKYAAIFLILGALPTDINPIKLPYHETVAFFCINLIMVANFAVRIRSTRSANVS